ncbi:unnamed protein product [Cladocopium goreaui]|uniref:UPF0652 protein n=1 Tax=Cladocopium goreaui TaxID=2562237 RepID=A0A9P1M6E3_9DINO|nr:unnamed protein product [Cladocopium goreaui]
MDTFYQKETSKLLKGLQEDCRVKPQVIIVGATRTGAVSAFLRRHMNQTEVMPVVTTDAHVPPKHLEQVFVPTKGKRLLSVLYEVLGEVPTVGKKTLIFTNRLPTCKMVFRSLQEHGLEVCALHGKVHPDKRKEAYEAFQGTGKDVMVCTNLASRGLDFSNVHHVVMYDFPLNMADYLHRVGRTARGGRAGRVTTITPRRYWPFVAKIQEATKEGKAIEVRNMSRKVKKILAIENFQKVIQSNTVDKSVKAKLKKRLGLPPARNIGSKETKAAMKRLDRRMKAIKELRFLWKRGILKRGQKIPSMPDKQVELSESQTVSTMVRARDGLLQLLPRRRVAPKADTALAAPNAQGTVSFGGLGGRAVDAPGTNRRRFNREPCDRLIYFLKEFFNPEDPGPEPMYSLAIEEGINGARLSHPHSRQYTFVLQSMTLWREVLDNMFQLWHMAEEDLLDDEQQYQLADTGQGYQRVQKSVRSVVAMQKILADVQRKVGGWVGSSIVHLGDHNVPNALMFIDKYIQVPRFLGPLVLTLDKIPELSRSTAGMKVYIESFGGVRRLQKLILADFFRHAFDGSGADNFFDAGDGRTGAM